MIFENKFPDKKYDVICADPPWEYKQAGNTKRSRINAIKHYPTMSTADICKFPVADIAENDALLFLWITFLKT